MKVSTPALALWTLFGHLLRRQGQGRLLCQAAGRSVAECFDGRSDSTGRGWAGLRDSCIHWKKSANATREHPHLFLSYSQRVKGPPRTTVTRPNLLSYHRIPLLAGTAESSSSSPTLPTNAWLFLCFPVSLAIAAHKPYKLPFKTPITSTVVSAQSSFCICPQYCCSGRPCGPSAARTTRNPAFVGYGRP